MEPLAAPAHLQLWARAPLHVLSLRIEVSELLVAAVADEEHLSGVGRAEVARDLVPGDVFGAAAPDGAGDGPPGPPVPVPGVGEQPGGGGQGEGAGGAGPPPALGGKVRKAENPGPDMMSTKFKIRPIWPKMH